MKFTYAYKTSDGVRHEDELSASSREEVFAVLRARGIKAIKVVAADGSKANGEAAASRFPLLRAAAIAAIAAIAAAWAASAYFGRRAVSSAREGDVGSDGGKDGLTGGRQAYDNKRGEASDGLAGETTSVRQQGGATRDNKTSGDGRLADADKGAGASPRHQIYGDPAFMETLERGDFGDILPRAGDRFLAVFAQPGKYMMPKDADARDIENIASVFFGERQENGGGDNKRTTTSVGVGGQQQAYDNKRGGLRGTATSGGQQARGGAQRADGFGMEAFEAYARSELAAEKDIAIQDADSREVRELKQIVNGMREEMREYLANGNGTPRSYWRRLNERTAEEMQIYGRIRRELENETSEETREKKNAALRRLGLRTIPGPRE